MNANGGVAKEAAKLNRELKDSQKEVKKLEKELQRKKKALAEAAALLVLSKKQMRSGWDPEGEKYALQIAAMPFCLLMKPLKTVLDSQKLVRDLVLQSEPIIVGLSSIKLLILMRKEELFQIILIYTNKYVAIIAPENTTPNKVLTMKTFLSSNSTSANISGFLLSRSATNPTTPTINIVTPQFRNCSAGIIFSI